MNVRMLMALLLAMVVAAGCGQEGDLYGLTPPKRRAREAARQWLVDHGSDVENTTFEVWEREEGQYLVDAQSWPEAPGGHTTFVVDADGKVTEMWPGE